MDVLRLKGLLTICIPGGNKVVCGLCNSMDLGSGDLRPYYDRAHLACAIACGPFPTELDTGLELVSDIT